MTSDMCNWERVYVDLAVVCERVDRGVWLTVIAGLEVDWSSVTCSVGDADVLVEDSVVVDFKVTWTNYDLKSVLGANLCSLVDVVGDVGVAILSENVEVKTFGGWEEGLNERTIGVVENLENSRQSRNRGQMSHSLS